MNDLTDQKEFEERADYSTPEDLKKWNVDNEYFQAIQNKLIQKGAKLIVGPRGTGKTHQMRLAYDKCIKNKKYPLALYTSFSKYYHLEPFLFKSPNAKKIFHTWVLGKIILSCYKLVDEGDYSDIMLDDEYNFLDKKSLEEFVSQAEKGTALSQHDKLITKLTINSVIKTIESLAIKLKRKKVVLLLDDAALSLTPDYMIEFFDIFRSLKTVRISPKASVYPGTPSGPRLHIGHDVESFQSWIDIETDYYSAFMDDIIEKRSLTVKPAIPKDIIELFKYASFGVPRFFLNLLRRFLQDSGKSTQQKFNNVISEQVKLIKGEYLSLYQKMPQYKSIIETGFYLFETIVDDIVTANKNLQNEKQILIGIEDEQNISFDRMMRFLIEAGLLYDKETVSHGENRKYHRYIPHFAFLMQKRAFSSGKRGFDSGSIIKFINRKQSKHPVRRSFGKLLSAEQIENMKLDLPPCNHCGTPRLTEEQKFCHSCGHELVDKSAFEDCMKLTIDDLPISDWQKKKIKEESNLKTVNDFLTMPDPGTELRKPHGIGPVRSEQIFNKVQQLVEEFLS
ncbi:MAG: zinc ribbon domain-containing protein [Deltaproteobacteria bacterium]|nr:zinc ribbon domain-containing protein [Deltaproteobacteria bacterium]